MMPRFDAQEIAKRMLGIYWRKRTEEERQEFIQLFTELMERSYRGTLDRYSKDVQFFFDQERIDGDFAQVDTRVYDPAQDKAFSVNYRLHRVDRKWLIYDVIIRERQHGAQLPHTILPHPQQVLLRRASPEHQEQIERTRRLVHLAHWQDAVANQQPAKWLPGAGCYPLHVRRRPLAEEPAEEFFKEILSTKGAGTGYGEGEGRPTVTFHLLGRRDVDDGWHGTFGDASDRGEGGSPTGRHRSWPLTVARAHDVECQERQRAPQQHACH
jgi:hypothetical protein